MEMPASVDSKPLTRTSSPLDATLMKNMGGRGCYELAPRKQANAKLSLEGDRQRKAHPDRLAPGLGNRGFPIFRRVLGFFEKVLVDVSVLIDFYFAVRFDGHAQPKRVRQLPGLICGGWEFHGRRAEPLQ